MRAGWVVAVAVLALTACSGGDSSGEPVPAAPSPLTLLVPSPRDPVTRSEFVPLATGLPGGRVSGISETGVAVGYEGRPPGGPPTVGNPGPLPSPPPPVEGERAVWWRDGRAVRLAVPDPGPPVPQDVPPRVSPRGLVGELDGAGGWFDGTDPAVRGGRSTGSSAGSSLLDVDDAGRVLVRDVPDNPMAKPWAFGWHDVLVDPDGTRTALGMEGRFLLPDGSVAGTTVVGDGNGYRGPAVWRNGTVTELPLPFAGHLELAAAAGDVLAGTMPADPSDPDGPARAVAWHGGRPVQLQSLGGARTTATAVGPDGTVAGTSTTIQGRTHAVVWNAAGHVTDLGTLEGYDSGATGISGSGADRVVVGWSANLQRRRTAVAWTGRGIVDLGPRGTDSSQAEGVTGDRVYGVAERPGEDFFRPGIWTLSRG